MSEERSQIYSRREWLMLIAILMLLEYWIISFSYTHEGEQAVLNYISFAGTIASILLAVVAIIYSFYQNDSQQQGSAKLFGALDSLRSLASRLGESPIKLEVQLDRLDRIASKLDTVDTHIQKSNQRLQSIEELVKGFDKPHTPSKPPSSSPRTLEQTALALLNASSFEGDIAAYLLHKMSASSEVVSIADMFSKYLGPALEKATPQNVKPLFLFGAVYQTLGALSSVGLLEWQGSTKSYKILPTLKAVLPEAEKSARNNRKEWLVELLDELDVLFEYESKPRSFKQESTEP